MDRNIVDRFCSSVAIWRQKIPELMRGLGRGVREFKDAKDNVRRELEESATEPDTKPSK